MDDDRTELTLDEIKSILPEIADAHAMLRVDLPYRGDYEMFPTEYTRITTGPDRFSRVELSIPVGWDIAPMDDIPPQKNRTIRRKDYPVLDPYMPYR